MNSRNKEIRLLLLEKKSLKSKYYQFLHPPPFIIYNYKTEITRLNKEIKFLKSFPNNSFICDEVNRTHNKGESRKRYLNTHKVVPLMVEQPVKQSFDRINVVDVLNCLNKNILVSDINSIIVEYLNIKGCIYTIDCLSSFCHRDITSLSESGMYCTRHVDVEQKLFNPEFFEGDSEPNPKWFPEWIKMTENEKIVYLDKQMD